MIQVNRKIIEALNPCEDRLENYLKHYAEWSGSLSEFLDLNEITHSDKCWVYFRLIPQKKIGPVAGEIAEQVLHIYEAAYPNDYRPRRAIEAAKTNSVDMAYRAAEAERAAVWAAEAVERAGTWSWATWAAYRAAAMAAEAAEAAAGAERAALAGEESRAAVWATEAVDRSLEATEDLQAMEAKQIEIMKKHLEEMR